MKKLFKILLLFGLVLPVMGGCVVLWGLSQMGDRISKRYDFHHILPENIEIHGITAPKNSKLHYFLYSQFDNPQPETLAETLKQSRNIDKVELSTPQPWGDFTVSEIGTPRLLTNGVSILPVNLKNPVKTDWYQCELDKRIYFETQQNAPAWPNWQPQYNTIAAGCEQAGQVQVLIDGTPFVLNKINLLKSRHHLYSTPEDSKRFWYVQLSERDHSNTLFQFGGLIFDENRHLVNFYGRTRQAMNMNGCHYPADEYVDVTINGKNQSLWAWTRWDSRPQACFDIQQDTQTVLKLFEQVSGSLKTD